MLMVKKLSYKEREFVTSIRRQIMNHPRKFHPSQRQWEWLKDIYWRHTEHHY